MSREMQSEATTATIEDHGRPANCSPSPLVVGGWTSAAARPATPFTSPRRVCPFGVDVSPAQLRAARKRWDGFPGPKLHARPRPFVFLRDNRQVQHRVRGVRTSFQLA